MCLAPGGVVCLAWLAVQPAGSCPFACAPTMTTGALQCNSAHTPPAPPLPPSIRRPAAVLGAPGHLRSGRRQLRHSRAAAAVPASHRHGRRGLAVGVRLCRADWGAAVEASTSGLRGQHLDALSVLNSRLLHSRNSALCIVPPAIPVSLWSASFLHSLSLQVWCSHSHNRGRAAQ